VLSNERLRGGGQRNALFRFPSFRKFVQGLGSHKTRILDNRCGPLWGETRKLQKAPAPAAKTEAIGPQQSQELHPLSLLLRRFLC